MQVGAVRRLGHENPIGHTQWVRRCVGMQAEGEDAVFWCSGAAVQPVQSRGRALIRTGKWAMGDLADARGENNGQ